MVSCFDLILVFLFLKAMQLEQSVIFFDIKEEITSEIKIFPLVS